MSNLRLWIIMIMLIALIVIIMCIWAWASVLMYVLQNPESTGEYVGRIVDGFNTIK